MTAADLSAWLIEATLATSAAVLGVLALRKLVRNMFGPGAGYAVWGMVPAALLATWLPASTAVAPIERLLAVQASIRLLAVEAPHPASPDIAGLACLAWALGVLVCAIHFARLQRCFMRGLGPLVGQEGVWLADAIAGLPAVMGVWRPRIILPGDAMSRYDANERALMLAHERAHIARGDLLANVGMAALRCVFWFNPLMHVAARYFRDDQELACDQQVMHRHPQSRRAYGEAMLKAQLAGGGLPLGCHWGQTHPLKERIEMLKLPFPNLRNRLLGGGTVLLLTLLAGYAAWAAQPATVDAAAGASGNQGADFDARIEIVMDDGEPTVFSIGKRFGEAFKVGSGDAARPQIIATVVPVLHKGVLAYDIATRIERSGKLIATPRLVVRDGVAASVQQGTDRDGRFEGIRMEMAVTARDPQAARSVARPFAAPAPGDGHEARVDNASRMLAPPQYPAEASKQGKTGTSVLLVDIDATGKVTGLRLDRSAGDDRLDAAAMEAATRWKFVPAMKNGRPVPGRVRVPIQFALHDPDKAAG